jgi:hypothetical protein
MMNCRTVAARVAAGPSGRISWWRLDVRLHLLLCRHCRRFAHQMRQLGLASARCRETLEPGESGEEFEARVTRRLGGG